MDQDKLTEISQTRQWANQGGQVETKAALNQPP